MESTIPTKLYSYSIREEGTSFSSYREYLVTPGCEKEVKHELKELKIRESNVFKNSLLIASSPIITFIFAVILYSWIAINFATIVYSVCWHSLTLSLLAGIFSWCGLTILSVDVSIWIEKTVKNKLSKTKNTSKSLDDMFDEGLIVRDETIVKKRKFDETPVAKCPNFDKMFRKVGIASTIEECTAPGRFLLNSYDLSNSNGFSLDEELRNDITALIESWIALDKSYRIKKEMLGGKKSKIAQQANLDFENKLCRYKERKKQFKKDLYDSYNAYQFSKTLNNI